MKCTGYGMYKGKCSEKPVMFGTSYWCKRCDDLRKSTITSNLTDIVQGFENYMKDERG